MHMHCRHWTGAAPPPGPLPNFFLAVAKLRNYLTHWGADSSFALLPTITAVVGEPPFVLPPPFPQSAASQGERESIEGLEGLE